MSNPIKYPLQRVGVALAVFLPLTAFVVLVQFLFDAKTWTSAPYAKGVLIALALVYGSAAYDGFKRAFFMSGAQFIRFRNAITNLYFATAAVVLCCTAAAAILTLSSEVPLLVTSLFYVVAVVCLPWLVLALMHAFAAAASQG